MSDIGEKIRLLLEDDGIKYTQNHKSLILKCPKCRKSDKLYIRKSDGRFVCWVCADTEGFSGKPEWALAALTGRDIGDLRKHLYGASGPTTLFLDIRAEDFFAEDDEIPIFIPDELPEVLPAPGFVELAGSPGATYLAKRGIPLPVALEYDIKYWPAEGSVVFPVVSRGRLVGWQTRKIGKTEWVDEDSGVTIKIPKAMTSVGLKKERVLMFGDRITGDHAILCEGPIDAIKATQCGGNVASLGKLVSRTQLELLKHSGISKLYLALDPDAFIESAKILKEMSRYMKVFDMRPPEPYKDLGEMPMAEVKHLMDNAPLLGPNHIFIYLKEKYAR
jgi:hypothetical protein